MGKNVATEELEFYFQLYLNGTLKNLLLLINEKMS